MRLLKLIHWSNRIRNIIAILFSYSPDPHWVVSIVSALEANSQQPYQQHTHLIPYQSFTPFFAKKERSFVKFNQIT